EGLDCIDATARDARSEREAGEPRAIVDQDRAGAALAAVTAGLGAGEPDHLPQVVEQEQVVGYRVDAPAAVQVELENPRHLRAVRRGLLPASRVAIVRYCNCGHARHATEGLRRAHFVRPETGNRLHNPA